MRRKEQGEALKTCSLGFMIHESITFTSSPFLSALYTAFGRMTSRLSALSLSLSLSLSLFLALASLQHR